MHTPVLHTALITTIQKHTDTVYEFTFVFPDTAPMQFAAGQYGTVIIDSTTRRQYSFCSSPKQPDTIKTVIDTKPMGAGSQYFLSKKVGDTIQILAPLGTFVITPSPKKKIMIATGTGIAPIKSMILDAVGTADIQLLWGLRHEEDIYWLEEFQLLAQQHPTFSYLLTLSQPTTAWGGTRGRVTDHIQQIEHTEENEYYLCGNKQMIDDVTDFLRDHAVATEQIKTELF